MGQEGQGAQVGAGRQECGGGHVMGAAVVVVVDVACAHRSQERLHLRQHLRDWHFAGVLHFLWQNSGDFLS